MTEDFDFIVSYSRAEAIADGMLIEEPIEKLRKEYGMKYPCVMSHALFSTLEPSPYEASLGQSMDGRVWDMLTMFRHFGQKFSGSEMIFTFLLASERTLALEDEADEFKVKVVIGPGDTPEPVLTFMLPEED